MIKEHKLTPYPRRMWIARNENFDEIKGQFEFVYKSDSEITNDEIQNEWNAGVFKVSKNKYRGYLVFITDDCDDGHLVHEANHVALHVYEDCGMDLKPEMDQEPFCYLSEHIWRLLHSKEE